MPIILILTQDAKNESIRMLIEAFHQQINSNKANKIRIVLWEVNHQQTAKVVGNHLVLCQKNQFSAGLFALSRIPLSDMALVIKRTWGPIRAEALHICQMLENNSIPIINGCHFIAWTHSKIAQYRTLEHKQLMPPSLCFDQHCIDALDHHNLSSEIQRIVSQADTQLSLPIIFKTSRGCRAEGVYLVESTEALQRLITEYITSKDYQSQDGFIMQRYIPSHKNKSISQYYRINIIDGIAHSAVQFQLQWQATAITGINKLIEFKQAHDKPVSLTRFDATQLKRIMNICPIQKSLVGIDAVWSEEEQRLYLLEYNDGPNISLTVNLGKKLQAIAATKEECAIADQCANFAIHISEHCINYIHSMKQAPLMAKL